MILEQHYLSCLAQASYLIVCERTKKAVVVDPRRDVDLYLDRASELGATIEHVILTHFHADFLAGHLELAERTGATIWLGSRAQATYEFKPFAEGDRIELGDVRIEVLETPGHTPEGISILVFDLTKDVEKPHAVLTGDTLFIGDVGRPDLMASVGMSAEELAGMMYDSLRHKLMKLPDETVVYPGHGAGSACGKNMSSETVSTIGAQKELNYALQPMEREEFVRILTVNQPPAPAYFPRAANLNKQERGLLPEVLDKELAPLTLEALQAAQRSGAQILDTRPKDDFARGHLPGSAWIGLEGKFASWAGTLLDLDQPIVVIAEPGLEREAALRLGRIGMDRVVGYLDGGGAAFAGRPECTGTPRATVARTAEMLAEGEGAPAILDVRTSTEYADGHVEGAVNVPLAELLSRLEDVPRDGKLLVHCKSGYRSLVACSLLAARGIPDAVDVEGGFDAWTAKDLPVAVVV